MLWELFFLFFEIKHGYFNGFIIYLGNDRTQCVENVFRYYK